MSVSNQNVTLSGQFEHDDDLFFTSLNGFAGVVNITLSSPYPCGDGVIATAPRAVYVEPSPGIPAYFVSLQLLDTTPIGTYTVTVTATSGHLFHSLAIYVTVTRPPTQMPDFDISPNPTLVSSPISSVIVIPASSLIQVFSLGRFSGEVSLAFSANPGPIVALNPRVVSLVPCGIATSLLTVEAFSPGRFNITVTGRAGDLVHSVDVYFDISGLQPPQTTTASLSYLMTYPSAPRPGGLALLENDFTNLGQTPVRVISIYYSSDLRLNNASVGVGLPFSLDVGYTRTLEAAFPIPSTAVIGNHTIFAEARWQYYDTSSRIWMDAPSIFIRITLPVVSGRAGAGSLQRLADFTGQLGVWIFLGLRSLGHPSGFTCTTS